MASRLPVIDADGEVGDLSGVDPALFKSFKDLPTSLRTKLRGPQRTPLKERITIRLSPDVVQRFRDSGAGWQTRVDAALRDWLRTHTPVK